MQKHQRKILRLTAKFFAGSLSLLISAGSLPAYCASDSSPSGTILLPLTPRIDESELLDDEKSAPSQVKPVKTVRSSKPQPLAKPTTDAASPLPASGTQEPTGSAMASETPTIDNEDLKNAPEKISPEADSSTLLEASASEDDLKMNEIEAGITEDTTLKGTIQIVADDTEYDQEKNTFLGTGNAIAVINGQNSKLEADMILYDQNTQIMDARGNVKIIRDGQITTGSAFKFKVSSDEYLITSPDTEVKGTQVVARAGYGTRQGLAFRDGNMTLAKPFHIGKNVMFGPISVGQDVQDRNTHPDVYVAEKPSYIFKARKMVYERYKENGNLTIFGGRVCFGNFTVPLPKFVATVGTESNVMFPVTPIVSSNIQSGGINVGPSFNYSVGKTGKLNWAPMIQFGGRDPGTTGSSLGLSGQVGFSNDKFSTHLAYGSVSKLLVADFKTKLTKKTDFVAGINRYMTDGLYGYRRAHLIAEVVDQRYISNVPYLSGISFRSAGGWAQDNPQLINQTPQFAQLYGKPITSTKQPSAFRLSEQIIASTRPIFSVGDDRYGTKMYFYGGAAASAYSSGNARMMLQAGPTIDTRLNKLHFQASYNQSAIRGSSPFLFDQFLQGSRSVNLTGDVKISKWLTLGGGYGYSFTSKMAYSKTISAAIGPDDFKLLMTRNVIQGINRFGFDVLYGQPVSFNRLVLKGTADHGNLGGI